MLRPSHAVLRRLLARQTNTKMHAIIGQLCSTLAVGSADAILPTMQQLQALSAGSTDEIAEIAERADSSADDLPADVREWAANQQSGSSVG